MRFGASTGALQVEKRKHSRHSLQLDVEFAAKGSETRTQARLRDLSLGGVFVETRETLPFRAEVTVYMRLPGVSFELVLGGVVRWTRADGMGVQFSPMGARETHAITEALRDA